MIPLSSELPFHVQNWLIISLKDVCIVGRKWPTFLPTSIESNHNACLDVSTLDGRQCHNILIT